MARKSGRRARRCVDRGADGVGSPDGAGGMSAKSSLTQPAMDNSPICGQIMAQLFGVEPADPLVLPGMTAAFALCRLIAVAWPARAAASLDPAAALKD